ncbi:MAG: hypothetical protein K9N49_05605, partial [Candidatus Marinimicrobia bacterium]|nr:hypothetical protein [Candidatus Neomarinimicrobiota bacterium]
MALKSAWELALEKTGGVEAGPQVTAAQRAALAAVSAKLKADLAELDIMHQAGVAAAGAAQDGAALQELDTSYRAAGARLPAAAAC